MTVTMGALFGVTMYVDDDLPPGVVHIYPGEGLTLPEEAIPELPRSWAVMDNAARISWLSLNARVRLYMGQGTTEEMMSLQGRLEA